MFYHPYWASFNHPYWSSFSRSYWTSSGQPWINHEIYPDEIPFVKSGRMPHNGFQTIRRRVGWALVQIGLWLVVRSTEGLPGMPDAAA